MANTIRLKRGTTTPQATSLVTGELAINTTNGYVYTKTDAGAVVQVGSVGGGSWGSITGTLSSQTDLNTALGLKAPLESPALTGIPTGPTASTGTDTTQLATTAFVTDALNNGTAKASLSLTAEVRNETGSTLTKGTVVYINGASSNKATVAKAQANSELTSAQTYGVLSADIATGHNGIAVIGGIVSGIDTFAFVAGTALYLSPTVAGGLTSSKPSAPQHLVYIGVVAYQHATQGSIQLRMANGYELNEIHDVAISSVADGHLVSYEAATNLWKNKSPATLGLVTTSSLTPQVSTLSTFTIGQQIGYQHTFRMNSASLIPIELATSSQYGYPLGTRATFVQVGEGKMDFTPQYGATILSYGNKLRSSGQNAVVNVVKTGSDEWAIYGELEASVPPAGTILSSSCISTDGYDANNNYWTGTWSAEIVYANGSGGSYTDTASNTLGCWYPNGYVIETSTSDSSLSWNHGVDSGDFVYGYTTASTVANGDGTSTSGSSTTITATDGQTVHTYEGYDGANGWNTNEILYFDLATTSLVANSYPASGVVTSAGCTSVDSTDASGNLYYAVGAYYTTTADGYGGEATSYQFNNETCGYLPSGYWTSYSSGDSYFSYYDEYGTEQTFTYGQTTSGYYQDGYGGSVESTNTSNYYESGYVFYSYYDGAGGNYIYFAFDGMNSYYTYS